jgi:hypothetical protein
VVDDSFQTVFQNWDVEVDEQAHGPAAESKVGEKLSFVNRGEAFYGFDLDRDAILDQQVEPITAIQFQAFVLHGKRNFFAEWHIAKSHFLAEALLVSRFEQAGAEQAIYLDRGTNDLTCNIIDIHDRVPFADRVISPLGVLCVSAVRSFGGQNGGSNGSGSGSIGGLTLRERAGFGAGAGRGSSAPEVALGPLPAPF